MEAQGRHRVVLLAAADQAAAAVIVIQNKCATGLLSVCIMILFGCYTAKMCSISV